MVCPGANVSVSLDQVHLPNMSSKKRLNPAGATGFQHAPGSANTSNETTATGSKRLLVTL
jgi:hypothetical protein